MKLAAIFLGLMSAFVSASPAAAQWTGTPMGGDATAKDDVRAVEMIAECFVARHSAANHVISSKPAASAAALAR